MSQSLETCGTHMSLSHHMNQSNDLYNSIFQECKDSITWLTPNSIFTSIGGIFWNPFICNQFMWVWIMRLTSSGSVKIPQIGQRAIENLEHPEEV
jgi:hypothetical protein